MITSRRSVRLALVLSALGVTGALAAPTALADLTGSMKIREVRLLQPTEGAQRGTLLAWVRVDHARARHTADTHTGASHQGRMTLALRGPNGRRASGVAVRELDLPGHSTPGRYSHAYAVRFSRAAAGRLVARRSDRLQLTARVAQRLDLNGDRRSEDADGASTRRTLAAQAVSQTISPKAGDYTGVAGGVGYSFRVVGGAVTDWRGGPSGCNARTIGTAPIDPVTGAFTYRGRGQVVANLTGSFIPPARFTSDAVGSLTGSAQGTTGPQRAMPRRCSFSLRAPSGFAFGYVAPRPTG